MGVNTDDAEIEPSRSGIDALEEPVIVEFGASWCGHCIAAQPLLASSLAAHPQVRHIRIEDGPGHKLGRSFAVRLWPTLIFMRHGIEVTRLVRPSEADMIEQAIARIELAPAMMGDPASG